jgi:hypothetical protein
MPVSDVLIPNEEGFNLLTPAAMIMVMFRTDFRTDNGACNGTAYSRMCPVVTVHMMTDDPADEASYQSAFRTMYTAVSTMRTALFIGHDIFIERDTLDNPDKAAFFHLVLTPLIITVGVSVIIAVTVIVVGEK